MSAAAVATAEQYSDTNGRDIRSERKYARTQATGENYYYYSMSMLPCWRSTRFKLYVYYIHALHAIGYRTGSAQHVVWWSMLMINSHTLSYTDKRRRPPNIVITSLAVIFVRSNLIFICRVIFFLYFFFSSIFIRVCASIARIQPMR